MSKTINGEECERDYKKQHYWERVGVSGDFIIYQCAQCRKCRDEFESALLGLEIILIIVAGFFLLGKWGIIK